MGSTQVLVLVDKSWNSKRIASYIVKKCNLSHEKSLHFKESPMSLILVGQTELWDQKLRLQKYAAIRQRIDMSIVLERLDRAETTKYMAAHLAYSASEKELFTTDAEEEIYKVSSGIPRMINRICEKSLMYAFQQRKRLIDGHIVRYVAEHEMLKGAE